MWQIEVRHDGLNKYRVIRGNDKYIVDQKAEAQKAVWDEMWQKRVVREQQARKTQSKLDEAEARTKNASDAIAALTNTNALSNVTKSPDFVL